jgi:hypothetical protein
MYVTTGNAAGLGAHSSVSAESSPPNSARRLQNSRQPPYFLNYLQVMAISSLCIATLRPAALFLPCSSRNFSYGHRRLKRNKARMKAQNKLAFLLSGLLCLPSRRNSHSSTRRRYHSFRRGSKPLLIDSSLETPRWPSLRAQTPSRPHERQK